MRTRLKPQDKNKWSLPTSFTKQQLAVAVLALCLNANAQITDNSAPQTSGPTTQPEASAPSSNSATLPVQLIPNREATLSSEITTPVERLPYKLGDSFKAGAVLAILDCKELDRKSTRLNSSHSPSET
jgi:multidrug efflux pump subunit AcrA (membrane-fusion protein)